MEEAATTADPRWRRRNGLWGQFDIYAVYVARGARWEPIVQEGRLDLRYRVTPMQWAEGLTFDTHPERVFDRLTWLTPFDLLPPDAAPRRRSRRRGISAREVPTLQRIIHALIARLCLFVPGKRPTPDDVWHSLSDQDRSSLQTALEQAARIPIYHHDFRPAPKGWPGRWIGSQTFPFIPPTIIPYLKLASILRVGRHTHFGCGAFEIG